MKGEPRKSTWLPADSDDIINYAVETLWLPNAPIVLWEKRKDEMGIRFLS
jgi:hypothetical protein